MPNASELLPLSLLCFLPALACGSATLAPSTEQARDSIEWRAYSPEVFEVAAREGKWVLLDVGIEGCTACRWMLEDTYQHPEVVRRVNEHFVAVAVDAGARPDLGERYAAYAWPATIVLSADGAQMLALRGNKRPRNFIPLLDRFIEDPVAPELAAPEQVEFDHDAACALVEERTLALRRDDAGWGANRFRGVQAELAVNAFARAATRNHALSTAEAYSLLLDAEWGGVFVGSIGDWEHPIVEKRLRQQAGALTAFAHAYALSGDDTWLLHARAVDRYIGEFLLREDGGFYASQRDEAPRLPQGMSASEYFRLPDAERRAHGVPLVDEGVYSTLNALAIEAYALLAQFSGDQHFASRAAQAAEVLRARIDDGVVAQLANVPPGERLRSEGAFMSAPGPVLETQAQTGLAMLALYRATQNSRYLESAVEIAEATQVLAILDGGFRSAPSNGPLADRVPPVQNALAARFFYALLDHTHELEYEALADGALAVANRAAPSGGASLLGQLALAHRWRRGGLTDVSIVGDEEDPAAQTLLRAGQADYVQNRFAHFDRQGRYPDQGRPAAFVCTRNACSAPLFDPAELRRQILATADVSCSDSPAAP